MTSGHPPGQASPGLRHQGRPMEERILLHGWAGDWLASLHPALHLLAFGGLGETADPRHLRTSLAWG